MIKLFIQEIKGNLEILKSIIHYSGEYNECEEYKPSILELLRVIWGIITTPKKFG